MISFIKIGLVIFIYSMKLIKTIERIILEAEEQYNSACESFVSNEELNRLEKNYRDSLKLLNLYKTSIRESNRRNSKS
jgi:hypothetical protein